MNQIERFRRASDADFASYRSDRSAKGARAYVNLKWLYNRNGRFEQGITRRCMEVFCFKNSYYVKMLIARKPVISAIFTISKHVAPRAQFISFPLNSLIKETARKVEGYNYYFPKNLCSNAHVFNYAALHDCRFDRMHVNPFFPVPTDSHFTLHL